MATYGRYIAFSPGNSRFIISLSIPFDKFIKLICLDERINIGVACSDEDKDLAKLLTDYQDMVGLLSIHKVARTNTQVLIYEPFSAANFFVATAYASGISHFIKWPVVFFFLQKLDWPGFVFSKPAPESVNLGKSQSRIIQFVDLLF